MILKFKRNLKKIVVLLLIFSYFFINNVNAEDNVYIYILIKNDTIWLGDYYVSKCIN